MKTVRRVVTLLMGAVGIAAAVLALALLPRVQRRSLPEDRTREPVVRPGKFTGTYPADNRAALHANAVELGQQRQAD